ncbi:MAG TPA: MOSC N-terminal beta barrel domain-containing protein, partial [Chryseosolibacter sp.]|nr:MOSC N-terminal beta barrel domain-containing protein [Chryseosolibacter sp.]
MNNLLLSEIWIYPVKSLGGISMKTAEVKRKGLRYDRRWMLIDSHGVAMTQRVYHEMALFKLSLDDGNINIAYTKDGRILHSASFIPENAMTGSKSKARVWDDEVEVVINTRLSEWFSELLHTTCRFVAFPENNPRKVDPQYNVNEAHVSLADAYPFLIIGQRSLDDLNQKLEHSVPMNRFR